METGRKIATLAGDFIIGGIAFMWFVVLPGMLIIAIINL